MPFPRIEQFFPVFRATCFTLSPAKQAVQLRIKYNPCSQAVSVIQSQLWPWLAEIARAGVGRQEAEGVALFHKVFASLSIVDQ